MKVKSIAEMNIIEISNYYLVFCPLGFIPTTITSTITAVKMSLAAS